MARSRADRIFFPVLLIAGIAGYVLSNHFDSSDDLPTRVELPLLPAPELDLEAPFHFPYQQVEFKARAVPALRIGGDLEAVLSEVRRVLLKSAAPARVTQTEELVASRSVETFSSR